MGHLRPFEFEDNTRPQREFAGFCVARLHPRPVEPGSRRRLDAPLSHAGLVQKSRWLSELFVDLVADICPSLQLVSPANVLDRGSHVSFSHPEATPSCRR